MIRCSSISSKSTRQVYGRARALGPLILPLALVGGVALDNGGFDATAWGWSTLLPLVIVGTALVLGRARSPHGLARAFLGLLGAFTAWTWLSAAWSNDVSASVLDAERLLLYLAAVAAFLLLERSQVTRFLAGLLASVSLVAVWALSLRAFGGPGSYDVASVSADATRRLAAPLGYSNALGLIAAIGIVLALGLAVRLRRPFAAAPVLVLAPTLYFTYSRGAWLALAAGGIAALGLATPRMSRRAMVAVAIVVICAGAIALVRVGGPSGAVRQCSQAAPSVRLGRPAALLILAGREPRPPVGRKARTAGVGAAVLLALVALGALAGNQILAAASASLDADEPARAARDARWAKRLVPWSPEPWRLHGEALLSQGDLDGARRDFLTALRKDASDWDSWVDLALVTRGTTQRRAVERAHLLNPLEPIRSGGG